MDPENKTVRHLEPAKTLGERIRRMRFTLARRASQLVVLGLFFGTALGNRRQTDSLGRPFGFAHS